jgi:RimJ/RimL family protein N-acetyltransferase
MLKLDSLELTLTTPEDIPWLLAIIRMNSEQIMQTSVQLNEQNLGTFLMQTQHDTQAQSFTIRKSGKIIGLVVLSNIHPIKRSCCFRLLVIDKAEHSSGWGYKAGALIMNYGWNTLNLQRIYARTYTGNNSMEAIYNIGGFILEGTERKESYINGSWVDCNTWGVLKEEFNFKKLSKILGGKNG